MGGLGSLFNNITKPLGVKIFPGGPYDGRDQVYEAGDMYSQLYGIGNKMLGSTYNANGGENVDMSGMMQGLTQGLSDITSGRTGYGLRETQRQQLNQKVGGINTQRSTSLAKAKQALAARGITRGTAYDAALQRINQAYDDMQNEDTTNYMEASRTQQMSEMGALLQQLLGQSQYGTSLISNAAAGKLGVAQPLAQAGQDAIDNLMGALAAANTMGMFGGSQKPKTTADMSAPW